jgi:hypothetical protein
VLFCFAGETERKYSTFGGRQGNGQDGLLDFATGNVLYGKK